MPAPQRSLAQTTSLTGLKEDAKIINNQTAIFGEPREEKQKFSLLKKGNTFHCKAMPKSQVNASS
jgi:hypothetical protein